MPLAFADLHVNSISAIYSPSSNTPTPGIGVLYRCNLVCNVRYVVARSRWIDYFFFTFSNTYYWHIDICCFMAEIAAFNWPLPPSVSNQFVPAPLYFYWESPANCFRTYCRYRSLVLGFRICGTPRGPLHTVCKHNHYSPPRPCRFGAKYHNLRFERVWPLGSANLTGRSSALSFEMSRNSRSPNIARALQLAHGLELIPIIHQPFSNSWSLAACFICCSNSRIKTTRLPLCN